MSPHLAQLSQPILPSSSPFSPLIYSLNAQYSLTVRQSSSPVASDHHVSIPPHRHQNLVGRVSYNIIFTHLICLVYKNLNGSSIISISTASMTSSQHARFSLVLDPYFPNNTHRTTNNHTRSTESSFRTVVIIILRPAPPLNTITILLYHSLAVACATSTTPVVAFLLGQVITGD